MNGSKLLQQMFGLTLVVLLLVGCGGAPAGSTPTVAGKIERDGQPVIDSEVTLVLVVETGDGESQSTQTNTKGEFVFEDVVPGTYYLVAAAELEGHAQCSTTSPGFDMLTVSAEKKDTGAPVTLAMATNSENPFQVKSSDQLTKDIIIRCE